MTTTSQGPRRRVIHLPEVSQLTGLPESTLRYYRLRGRGEGPRTFKIGARVVAYEDEVISWIEAQAAATSDRQPATA